jgi:hypothetical protein
MARMRSVDSSQSSMFRLMPAESRIPQDHPRRTIKKVREAVLKGQSPTFGTIYSQDGREVVAENGYTIG